MTKSSTNSIEVLTFNAKEVLANVVDKRGIHPVKQYLHRRGILDGESVFIKYRRKHNRTYKEVAYHQYIVDEIKTFFELQKMRTRIINDPVEGYGIIQIWYKVIGTVKQREFMNEWLSDENLKELVKITIFDGAIGGLDRHGNNVIVLPDKTLLTIDDEDVFYGNLDNHGKQRVWVKFDKDIKRMMYMVYLRNKQWFDDYVDRVQARSADILKIADCDVMKTNEQYPFYSILENNLKNLKSIYQETIRQFLL